jgi:hypothetical protein
MENKIVFRNFGKGDYEIAKKWWEWWWKGEPPIEKEILPSSEQCFIIEYNNTSVACGFLYIGKTAPIGYLTWVVSNPEYRNKNRRRMLELLIENIEKKAKQQGIKFLFTVCGNIHMENIHNKLGWKVDKSAPAYETFKYI